MRKEKPVSAVLYQVVNGKAYPIMVSLGNDFNLLEFCYYLYRDYDRLKLAITKDELSYLVEKFVKSNYEGAEHLGYGLKLETKE